jgi:hypothetical protein
LRDRVARDLLDRIHARRARADERVDGFLERRIVPGGLGGFPIRSLSIQQARVDVAF